jgi:hypothetical protein
VDVSRTVGSSFRGNARRRSAGFSGDIAAR